MVRMTMSRALKRCRFAIMATPFLLSACLDATLPAPVSTATPLLSSSLPPVASPSNAASLAPSPSLPSNPSASSANAPVPANVQAAQILVDASAKGAMIGANQFGSNLAAWFDISQAGVSAGLARTGVHLLRWPGGSLSDIYHWQNHTKCQGSYINPNSTFDNFMKDVVQPGNYEVAITLNYGTNPACNGGGDPKEAAAWVAYAKTKGYNVHHWTVGNEEYGSWETDLHTPAHDAATYAKAVAGPNGYYQLIKQADPTAQVGVVVNLAASWDTPVLSGAKYDFVELHWYPQAPGSESDMTLLKMIPPTLTMNINLLRKELAAAGKPNAPIFLGEFNDVYSAPGKQSVSIVNGLFLGLSLGELLNAGVPMSAWWMGIGGGCGSTNANNSPSLYGFQNFGTYSSMSDGCPSLPLGTPFPPARAHQLATQFALPGNSMLTAKISTANPALSNVRAYAATQGTGYALLLFNLDQMNPIKTSVGISNATRASFNASTLTYGKAQYDDSAHNVWTGPVSQMLGSVNGVVNVTLPPWSMTVLKLL